MGGCFTLRWSPAAVAEVLGLADTPLFEARYNVAPSQTGRRGVPGRSRYLDPMRWGLIPSWTKEAKP
jgi:putative SOS response-associated peptidase YedK